jgi:hypothetical protein
MKAKLGSKIQNYKEMLLSNQKQLATREEPWLASFLQRLKEYSESEIEKNNREILGFSWSALLIQRVKATKLEDGTQIRSKISYLL